MFNNLDSKQKIIFIICILGMILVIIYYFFTNLRDDSTIEYENLVVENFTENSLDISEESLPIIVYITGEVISPGIVHLNPGDRIQDAINLANGLTENADLSNINLAYILSDGQKIYIPNKNEHLDLPTISNDDGVAIVSDSSSSGLYDESTLKVNINSATQTQLEELPGIGSSTALKIIEYRNKNGKFKSIEDLKNISGIGDAKFNKIKDYISIK